VERIKLNLYLLFLRKIGENNKIDGLDQKKHPHCHSPGYGGMGSEKNYYGPSAEAKGSFSNK